MIEFLKNWVLTIVALALFIILLEIIIPTGKIKKFVNLVSGFILIISIINPFLGLFNKGLNLKEVTFAGSNFIDKTEIEKSSDILKESQMKQIVNTYRNKIIVQVEEGLRDIEGIKEVKGDVIINEDYHSEAFGEIKRIYVNYKLVDKKQKIENIPRVEKIEIKGEDQAVNKAQNNEIVDKKLKGEIENRINKLIGVEKERIVINLEE